MYLLLVTFLYDRMRCIFQIFRYFWSSVFRYHKH